ncbi:unnamed protein product [Arabidopsis thaliana]|uniref:Uncharacterized protein n=1 Tax=Arabidopsis thaliana TaxID=3702 RepID=A0A5S9XQE4_ARATH|nr:unnamed protein product [Arabidopsis thaliana]
MDARVNDNNAIIWPCERSFPSNQVNNPLLATKSTSDVPHGTTTTCILVASSCNTRPLGSDLVSLSRTKQGSALEHHKLYMHLTKLRQSVLEASSIHDRNDNVDRELLVDRKDFIYLRKLIVGWFMETATPFGIQSSTSTVGFRSGRHFTKILNLSLSLSRFLFSSKAFVLLIEEEIRPMMDKCRVLGDAKPTRTLFL